MLELTLRLIFSLAVVLGLLIVLSRMARRRFRGGKDAMVQVVHRQAISRGTAVTVVTVGSRVLVLGTTEQQVRVLAELDPEELDASDFGTPDFGTTGLNAAGEPEGAAVISLVPKSDAPGSRVAGAHRAATPRSEHRSGARAGARRATSDSPLAGSVLSADTWRQAFAVATRRTS